VETALVAHEDGIGNALDHGIQLGGPALGSFAQLMVHDPARGAGGHGLEQQLVLRGEAGAVAEPTCATPTTVPSSIRGTP
jgi:hypothetical protein